MAYDEISAELAAKRLKDHFLNPEHVAGMMSTDLELRSFFEELIKARDPIDGQPFRRTLVHASADAPVNAEISVFYRYFISKCCSNLQNRDARSGLLDNYASIFPFRVDSSVQIDRVPILELFEREFLVKIRQFVDLHVIDSDYHDLEDMLIKNIECFRRKNFSSRFPMKYERLRAIAEIGSRPLETAEEPVGYVCQYLEHAYHLNEAGVDWYMNLHAACNEVNVAYNRCPIPAKGRAYFRYLPEINCCELLLLLERRFYLDDNERYAYLFKKYLLFFGHAVNFAEDVHPVFFIDEALFVCLTSLSKYLYSRTNALHMEYELWMMALVHLRMYTSSKPRGPVQRTIDWQSLLWVAWYVAENLGADASVHYETPLFYPVRHRNFYVRQDTVYRLMYVDVRRLALRHFYELILKAALLDTFVSRIVIYNAYTGEEMIIAMPQTSNDMRDLIVAMHMKIVPTLRAGPRGLPLGKAVELCDRFAFDWPLSDEMPSMETFLIRGKEECFSRPDAWTEVEFEPFCLNQFLQFEDAPATISTVSRRNRWPKYDRTPSPSSTCSRTPSPLSEPPENFSWNRIMLISRRLSSSELGSWHSA